MTSHLEYTTFTDMLSILSVRISMRLLQLPLKYKGSLDFTIAPACEFDETRVQDDCSVIGSEFCDFHATVLTFRLIKAFDNTYGKAMGVLKRAKKTRLPDEEWKLVRLSPSQEELLRKLELLPQIEALPKRKRGHPRNNEPDDLKIQEG